MKFSIIWRAFNYLKKAYKIIIIFLFFIRFLIIKGIGKPTKLKRGCYD